MTLATVTRINSAVESLKKELIAAYSAPDAQTGEQASEEDIQVAKETAVFVGQLLEKHVTPVMLAAAATAAATATTASQANECKPYNVVNASCSATQNVTPSGKEKSAWSIFLAVHAKKIPGWAEASSKPTFASIHYKKISKADREKIVSDYYAENGGRPAPGTGQKKVRVSGLDAFKKDWYARRRENNPDAKGIDSKCTDDWKSLSTAEKDKWKEIRQGQVAGQA